MEQQPRFVLGAVARSSWKTDRFLTIGPSATSWAQSCAHETMAHAKTISTCYPFLGFAFFPKPARMANGAVCENPEIPKNLPSRKNATRRAHKQNICRCAGAPSAQGHGCCIFANLSQKMLRIFRGEAAKLENQCFSTDSTHRKCSGGLLRACWVRSGGALGTFCGAHSPEPAARASLPAGPARITIASLPADRLPLRRSCSQSRSRPGQQAGRPQAELLR